VVIAAAVVRFTISKPQHKNGELTEFSRIYCCSRWISLRRPYPLNCYV